MKKPVCPDTSITEVDSEPLASSVLQAHDDDERDGGRNDEERNQDDEHLGG